MGARARGHPQLPAPWHRRHDTRHTSGSRGHNGRSADCPPTRQPEGCACARRAVTGACGRPELSWPPQPPPHPDDTCDVPGAQHGHLPAIPEHSHPILAALARTIRYPSNTTGILPRCPGPYSRTPPGYAVLSFPPHGPPCRGQQCKRPALQVERSGLPAPAPQGSLHPHIAAHMQVAKGDTVPVTRDCSPAIKQERGVSQQRKCLRMARNAQPAAASARATGDLATGHLTETHRRARHRR
jgi:hypothetical protein